MTGLAPSNRLTLLAAATIVATCLPAGAVSAAKIGEDAASYLPDTVPLTITLRDGDQQLQSIRAFLDATGFSQSPLYDQLKANPGLNAARIGLLGLAAAAETDPWEAVGSLLGREVTIGMLPGEGGSNAVIAASIARDPAALDAFLKEVHLVAGLLPGGKPDPARTRLVDGVRVFSLGEDSLHCRVDDALIFSNNRELMRDALRAIKSGENRLADSDSYRATRQAVPDHAAAWINVEPNLLRVITSNAEFADGKLPNALSGYILGGWWNTIRQGDSLRAWVTPQTGGLDLEVSVEAAAGSAPMHAAFTPEREAAPTWSSRGLDNYMAELQLDRGWADLFADRETLLTLPAASGVVNFSNGLSGLMGGLDFMDDVLTRVNGPARLILARQDFSDAHYSPAPKIPAFALVIPMQVKPGSVFANRLNSAALTTLAIIGADQGQKGNPGLLTQMEVYGGHQIVYGAYPAPDDVETDDEMMAAGPQTVGIQFNFQPAISLVGDEFIVATSRELLHGIIDAIDGDTPRSTPPVIDSLAIDASEVQAILRDNLEDLVVNRMLAADASKEEAQAFIESILEAVGLLDSVRVASDGSAGSHHGRIEIRFADKKD